MPPKRPRTPSSSRQSPIDTVMQLMAERQKYEQWIDDLEAKKDSTPEKVFVKVRHDYLERLQTVIDQLKEHTGAMQDHADGLTTQLAELEESETEITESLAEAELRAKVGEITQAEWEATNRKAQREIAKLKESQAQMSADLDRINELLSDAGSAPAPSAAPKPAPKSAEMNELEFLKSVVGTTGSIPAGKTPAPTPAAASTPVPPPAAPPPAPPAPPTAPASPPASAASSTPTSTPVTAAKPAPKQESSSGPLGDTTGNKEQPKTLKCAECGTMNYPSEWYCERCGAELTVV